MDIRNTLRTLRDELKSVSIELSNAYLDQDKSDSFGLKQRIAVLSVQKKTLRKRIDTIIDDICADTEHLERKSQAISIIDKANIENANLIRQRKADAHAKDKCLDSALRRVWSLRTFPYFQEILTLDNTNSESLDHAKRLARLAIYERAMLDHYLKNDSELLEQSASLFESISESDLNDINETINKVLKRTEKYFQEYKELRSKNQVPT